MDYNYIATLLNVIHKASGLGSKLGQAVASQATADLQAYWNAPPAEAEAEVGGQTETEVEAEEDDA